MSLDLNELTEGADLIGRTMLFHSLGAAANVQSTLSLSLDHGTDRCPKSADLWDLEGLEVCL